MTIRKRILTVLLCLALLCIIGGELLLSLFSVKVSASGAGRGSDVLSDLKQDSSFYTDNYPVITGSAELRVIHVAESTEGDVLIYVYQPNETAGKYTATSINISATTDGSLNVKNYLLELVNYDGVFQKYVVRDLKVLPGTQRKYEIVSIFRRFDKNIDKELAESNDNSIDEVVYKVAKEYTFTDTPEGYETDVSDIQTIEVTDKYVGFIRYPDGYGFWNDKDYQVDSHFISFSTNYHMDELLEADVYFSLQSYSKTGSGGKETYGSVEKRIAYLDYRKNVEYNGNGWFSQEYNWHSIAKTDVFLQECAVGNLYSQGLLFNINHSIVLSDEEKANIANEKQWVLRFATTEYAERHHSSSQLTYTEKYSTIVSEVTVLRLKFETDGIVYNLPVIDNKQTGSGSPIGTSQYTYELTELGEKVLLILCLILLVILFLAFGGPITVVLKIIYDGVKLIFKILGFIISFPFKILGFFLKPK
jgi:hypothetical protein